MLGKDLRKVLEGIKMTDYVKFLAEPRVYPKGLMEAIPLEEVIDGFTEGEDWVPLTKKGLISGVGLDEEYRVSELMIYRTNLEKDIGVQLYEQEGDRTVLALVVFDESPDLSKVKQLKIPYWFESRSHFEDWLNQFITVYTIYPTDKHVVDVCAQVGSQRIDLSIKNWEDFTEIKRIKLDMKLDDSFEAIESTINENITVTA